VSRFDTLNEDAEQNSISTRIMDMLTGVTCNEDPN